jgi:D-alanine-D-alanine ligase
MNITILYSTPTKRLSNSQFSVTDEDTTVVAKIFDESLKKQGHSVSLFPLYVDSPELVKNIKSDCIVNLIEWNGADLPAAKRAYEVLDHMHIPYTGSGWEGYELSSEKVLMKKRFEEFAISTPKSFIIPHAFALQNSTLQDFNTFELSFPCIVKLASDHCSIGLTRESIVEDLEGVKKQAKILMDIFHEDILVEEFIRGREFQITALEKDGKVIIPPPVEITFENPQELNFLTFGGRWVETDPDYEMAEMVLAKNIPESVIKRMEEESRKAFDSCALQDYARFDMRVRDEEVFMLEANANPGFDNTLESGVTLACHAAGIEFDELLNTIIHSAIRRFKKN